MTLSPADRRLLWSGGAVMALMLALTIGLLKEPRAADTDPSSWATGSGGAKVAFLLLEQSGYDVARWERPPAELLDPAHTTLIVSEPSALATTAERAGIHRFVEAGGRVIATGPLGAALLGGVMMPDPIEGLTWKPALAAAPSAITRAASTITIAPRGYWDDEAHFVLPLYAFGDQHQTVVAEIPMGAGEAFWWAAATPLTNAGLPAPGNLNFFLASIGPAGGRRVLFDEYFHGARASLAGEMWRSPVKWIALQLALTGALVLWTFARRSGPIIEPPVESRLSPLEFVRTLGSLYQRAGTPSVAVDIAARRLRVDLTRRLGVPLDAPLSQLQDAVERRWPVNAAAVIEALAAGEHAAGNDAVKPRDVLALVQAIGAQTAALGLIQPSLKETR